MCHRPQNHDAGALQRVQVKCRNYRCRDGGLFRKLARLVAALFLLLSPTHSLRCRPFLWQRMYTWIVRNSICKINVYSATASYRSICVYYVHVEYRSSYSICLYAFTCIQVPVVHIACVGVGQHKSFNPPLGWLLWHVLDEAEATLVSNHPFIYADLL